MEDCPEESAKAAQTRQQQPGAGSGQVQAGSGPAETYSPKPQDAVHPRKPRSKHRHHKRRNKAHGVTSAESLASRSTFDGRAEWLPGEVKVCSVSGTLTGNDFVEPTDSCAQPASPAAVEPKALYDESMDPPCTLPVTQYPSVQTPPTPRSPRSQPLQPSPAMHERHRFKGADLSPWTAESVQSHVSRASDDQHPGVAAPEMDTTHVQRSLTVQFGGSTVQAISAAPDKSLSLEKLVVCGSILGLTAGLICSIIVFVLLSGRGKHDLSTGDCTSQSCKRALHDLHQLMNFDVDPCQDFYSHVCQRWEQKSKKSGDGPISFLREGTSQLLRHLNSTLSSVNGGGPTSAHLYNLAVFYKSCERFVTAGTFAEKVNLLPFRAYGEELLSLHSFPAVVRYIIQLALVRGIHTVLEIRLNRFPDAVILRLLRGKTLLQKMDAGPKLPLEHYLKELTDGMSRMLGRQFSATDILRIELMVQKYTAQESEEKRQSITILENLTAAMSLHEWLSGINAHLPEHYKLTSRSIISIDTVDLIQQMLRFFSGLIDYGVVYLYVQVIADALRFDYLRRVSSNDTERVVSSCLRATRLVMRNSRNIIASQLFPEPTTDFVISRIFSNVLNAVSVPSTFSWMSAFMRGEATSTLHDVRIYDFRVYIQRQSFDEADRKEIPPGTSSFPGIFIDMKEREQWSILNDPPAPEDGDNDDAFFFSSDVFCNDQSNRVVVPASVHQAPILYTGDVPQEYVMGSLGVLFARALLRAALPQNSSGLWSAKESSYLIRFFECMDNLAREAFNASLGSDDSEKPRDVYIWAQSARSAFNALEAFYESRRTGSNWNSYWRSAQKTFFRRFCLLSCSVSRQQEWRTSRAPCVLPLANMKEFAMAFNCPHDTALRSANHCTLGSVVY